MNMKTWYVQTGDAMTTAVTGHAIHPDEAKAVTLHKVRTWRQGGVRYGSTHVQADTLEDAYKQGFEIIARTLLEARR